ncbi:hypothetical protein K4H28_03495 [Deefgea tanakiae]|uniref:Uncharacterized protein n=1 Tax=Deefgea tanakiae TaxID=2865840 RepID=A0ABX8Z7E8_9NEIS|nr:hypothetical protein [Deefgea tanakiae]QZA78493.1 hypothetical protein K4H28_03495 [Deefgea tanakiae]
MSTIEQRLNSVIAYKTKAYGRFSVLENDTGVGSDTWKACWHGRQRATSQMIEQVARFWPQYAFWVATGITDPDRGHVAPPTSEVFFPIIRGKEIIEATDYFKYLIKLDNEEGTDEDKKIRTLERETAFASIENAIGENKALSTINKPIENLEEAARKDLYELFIDQDFKDKLKVRNKIEAKVQAEFIKWADNIKVHIKIVSAIMNIPGIPKRFKKSVVEKYADSAKDDK